MIREQWYAVLYSCEIPKRKALAVMRFGEKIVFFRDAQGTAACLADTCPHRGASLSLGKLILNEKRGSVEHEKETCIACPFHGLRFNAQGTCVQIPANGKGAVPGSQYKAAAYPVREAHGLIWVYWGTKKENLPELPFFEDLEQSQTPMYYAQSKDYWKCHYSRCIENQLDAVHIPFVHATTIGRGYKTVINGPALTERRTETGQYELLIRADNEFDTGQIPKKTNELPPVHLSKIHLAFRFPNIWQNYIDLKMRIFISFVPVDEHNTILYLRTYQGFVRTPVIRSIVCFFLQRFSLKVAHQDRRVVETQKPDASALLMNEKLIPGDIPIVTYREKRQALKTYAERQSSAE